MKILLFALVALVFCFLLLVLALCAAAGRATPERRDMWL